MASIILRPGRDKSLLRHHPWIFSGAVQRVEGEPASGETVDLEAIIREQIILMVPLKPLCQEDCRGLCPICGANFNRETCSCQVEKSDSPFAQLAKLKV